MISGPENGGTAQADPAEQPEDCDVYIMNLSSSEYAALKKAGSLAELDAGESLRAGTEDMPEAIRERISEGGRLTAVPVASACDCLAWNVKAFQALSGRTPEELPTDWAGFLELLGEISYTKALINNKNYTLYESAVTTAEFRELLLLRILDDCLLWAEQDRNRAEDLPAVLTPILQALRRIEWSGLGLSSKKPKTRSGKTPADEGKTALLSVGSPEIAEMNLQEGIEFRPLSMTAGGERMIPLNVAVMWVSSRSSHPEAAARFVNDYWENMDLLTKMALCRSMNEPVADTRPDDEDYGDEDFGDEDFGDEEDEEASVNGEEPQWLASAESIGIYRGLAEFMVPAPAESPEAEEAVRRFLGGKISAGQFVEELASALGAKKTN